MAKCSICFDMFLFISFCLPLHMLCWSFVGIRSLQFKQELISVGTGAGNIVFYDLRAARFLSMIDESELTDIRRENICCRYASNGWLVSI